MNNWFRSNLLFFTLGIVMFFFGCGKSGSPAKDSTATSASPTDVVLIVPGMF